MCSFPRMPSILHSVSVAGLLLAVFILFEPMLVHMLWGRGFDYPLHLAFARDIREGQMALLPHPLFHLTVLTIVPLLPALPYLETYKQAGLIVGVGLYLLTALILYAGYIRPLLPGKPVRAVVVVILLLVVAPVNIISWREGHLYWGYFLPNIHFNPTLTILKPLALLLFLYMPSIFSAEQRGWGTVLTAAALTVLSSLAKPNFTIAFLPALALVAGWRLWRRKPVDWRLLMGGFIAPALILLAAQYFALSDPAVSGGGIAFQPLVALTERAVMNIPLKLLLSILFPLAVYGLHWREAGRDTAFNLAWIIFIIGAFYSYTLVESDRVPDNNFWWSGQIGVTVLFAATMVFWLRRAMHEGFTRRTFVICAALALHGLGGVFWYYADSVSPGFVWY